VTVSKSGQAGAGRRTERSWLKGEYRDGYVQWVPYKRSAIKEKRQARLVHTNIAWAVTNSGSVQV
jgi:hypothetical protein